MRILNPSGICSCLVGGLGLILAELPVRALDHTHTQIQIPMADIHPGTGLGVTLAADLYLPRSGLGPWPVVLIQTPYGKGNSYLQLLTERKADPLFNSPNYAFVVMDWRGFGTSGSQNMKYSGCPSGEQDGYQAVEWIADQSWCHNRMVGTWGASALGNIQMRTAALRPPSLRCAVPMVYHYREWYDQCYPGGVYARNRNDFVYGLFGGLSVIRGLPLKNAAWESIESGSGDPALIDIPMLHVTGWYDHETAQTIREMQAVQSSGGAGARGRQKLLIGPWAHGLVGARVQNGVEYPSAEFADSVEALAFFDRYLRGIANNWEDRAAVRFFQTNMDAWAVAEVWPPSGSAETDFYLWGDRSLARFPPGGESATHSWTANPLDPAPSLCGALVHPSGGQAQGPGDIQALAARLDVLLFATPVLTEPLHIQGDGRMVVWVSSNTTDVDVNVRLAQIHPDRQAVLLVEGVRRLSLRNGFALREWLQAGTVYEAEITLPPLAATLPPGHRLGVFVSAANFDRFDVNFHDGSDLSDEPGASSVVAALTLHTGGLHPSRLVLPTAAVPEPDSDADGLPDWWESLHGQAGAEPGSDFDADGVDAAGEYAAGTAPEFAASILAITGFTPHSTPFLEWASVENRRYDVWESRDLAGWTRIARNIQGTPPTNLLELPVGPLPERVFYRVSTGR